MPSIADWWVSADSYLRARRAVESGDRAARAATVARVASACARCPSLTRHRLSRFLGLLGPLAGFPAKWRARVLSCGRLGEPRPGASPPTCGCLLAAETDAALADLTVDGVPYRVAGKPEVASEGCPQGKWGPVPRVFPGQY